MCFDAGSVGKFGLISFMIPFRMNLLAASWIFLFRLGRRGSAHSKKVINIVWLTW